MIDVPRTVRVAAVQMESQNNAIQANLDRARSFVERAANEGAELILLPELMPTGYIFTPEIWDAAEPTVGPTVKWLKEHGRQLKVHLGTSFLEADGEDFYNTFVLVTPEGEEAGRVRKQTPALFEAWFTKGDTGPHIIETALGRIGVGICWDCQFAWFARLIGSQSVDLLLMPHSAASPPRSLFFTKKKLARANAILATLAPFYTDLLGVPTILSNKSGPFRSPIPGWPFTPKGSCFSGLSTLVDSDGAVIAQLGVEEGVIVGKVTLDPRRRKVSPPDGQGRWARKMPWGSFVFRGIEAIGSTRYRRSALRREKALMLSSMAGR
jgi:N-carbamoylputrescine amidase